MLHRDIHAIMLLLAGAFVIPQCARAAQSYDNCSGFIDSLPTTISTQGVWCLRHDLATAITSGNAITIATNNVTIDCNDFKVGGLAAGDGSQARGIQADGYLNATVRHCNIRGFYYGMYLHNGSGHQVENNRLDNNLFVGIYVSGDGSLVRHNRVSDTGGRPGSGNNFGIWASASVIENDIDGVFATLGNSNVYGISLQLGVGYVARGNRVRGLQSSGSGNAYGITGYTNATAAEGNFVSSSSGGYVNGYGITSMYACSNNIVVNFTNPYSCGYSTGNLP